MHLAVGFPAHTQTTDRQNNVRGFPVAEDRIIQILTGIVSKIPRLDASDHSADRAKSWKLNCAITTEWLTSERCNASDDWRSRTDQL